MAYQGIPILDSLKDQEDQWLQGTDRHLGLDCYLVNQEPPVVLIEGLLEPWEAKHIISLAEKKLEPSTMVVDNKHIVDQSGRSSRSAFLVGNGKWPRKDPVIFRLLEKLSHLCSAQEGQFEGMKVVNYRHGEKYLPHYDYFKDHDNFTKRTGDRKHTFFIYLNDLDEDAGGETYFPKLEINVRPKVGRGLFWVNIDQFGQYKDQTLHGGAEVNQEGVQKWGINVWIRERCY